MGNLIYFLNTSPGLNKTLKLIFGVLNKSRIYNIMLKGILYVLMNIIFTKHE